MKKVAFGAILVVLLALSFVAGHWYTLRDADKNTSAGRRILYYVDPMNPAHTSDKPGIAPCGMKMEPVYTDDGSPGQAPGSTSASMPAGTVRINPEKQQVIGVRTAVVEKAAVNHAIRTVGRVAPDEKRVYRLVAGIDGWIRETYNNDTGTLVKKDEHLASFYSPQFRAAQLAYLAILGSGVDRSRTGGREPVLPSQQASLNLQTYIDALESLGMSEQQMKELAETRQITDKVFIVAPVSGFIIARNVSAGQRFEKGTEWYRIADLSKVWVLADLFRNEAGDIKPGMKVRVTLPQQKKEFHAVVSTVLPQFDANSRTMKARLELDNPNYALRPDMFVDVEFPIALPAAITVPSDAIVDSGMKKTVFVDRGNGFFEPRQVETGWRVGGVVEITKGLMQGERIVISGNFLIDSESKMKMAAAGMQVASQPQHVGQRDKDPVCGMEVDATAAKAAGRASEYRDKTYYFCMDACKTAFEKKPEQYVETRVQGPGAGVQQKTDPMKGKPKGPGSGVKEQPDQTHAHDSSMQEQAGQSHPEKPTAGDQMGAHGPAHAPTR
jgi:Cu(I)/Ag(I) efflux system membrane fusion protein